MKASVPISLMVVGMLTSLRKLQLKKVCLSILRRLLPSLTFARDVHDANVYFRIAPTDDGTLIAFRDTHRVNARGPTSTDSRKAQPP